MQPFLRQLAEYYYQKLGDNISKYQFIFPSKRAALFFRHYLSQIATRPIFAPRTHTINNFVSSLLPNYHTLGKTELLFDLYQVYHRGNTEAEEFDKFVFWGEIILKDFDTIDRYLVDAKELYANLGDLKEIFDTKEYLDEDTQELLRGFFSGFEPTAGKSEEELSEYKRKFLNFWHKLYPLYTEFNAHLSRRGAVYEGHCYRLVADGAVDIVDRLIKETGLDEEHQLVFCGLHAISPAERKLLKQLKQRGVAEFCWDEQVCLFHTEEGGVLHPAIKSQLEDIRTLGQVRGAWAEKTGNNLPKHIELISCNTTIAQVKILPQLLEALPDRDELETAVILPNEQLLLPVVSSIPADFDQLNVTLGYPLDRTPIAVLVRHWTKLILSQQQRDEQTIYPIDNLLALLEIPLLQEYDPNLLDLIIELNRQKLFYLPQSDLLERAKRVGSTIGQQLLEVFTSADHFLSSLINLLSLFVSREQEVLEDEAEEEDIQTEEASEETTKSQTSTLSTFDIEFIFHYLQLCQQLRNLVADYRIEMQVATALRLLESLTQNIKIPFEGDPLGGVQIMGMLESRALQFRHLIIITAQEGSLPSSGNQQSLIPHIIKQGFGLPTMTYQEAIDAYIFYQAIGRAEQLTLLYSHQDILNGKGQESRYIYQLEYLYGCNIVRRNVQIETKLPNQQAITIGKSPEVMEQLSRFYALDLPQEEQRSLSASSINQYLSCPLRFYYEQVLGLRENEKHSPLMESNDFGTILHNSMQRLYEPYLGKPLDPETLKRWLTVGNTTISRAVKQSYLDLYGLKSQTLSPLAELYCEMIESYAHAVIRYDSEQEGQITYCASEAKFYETITLPSGTAIRVKGAIDRIDLVRDGSPTPQLRVIDYKTGKANLKTKAIADIFSIDGKSKAMTQTLLYCEMVARQLEQGRDSTLGKTVSIVSPQQPNISPQIFQLSSMIQQGAKYSGGLHIADYGKPPIHYAMVRSEYMNLMTQVLEWIFDTETPFAQTEEPKNCGYCPFRLSCGR